MVDAINSDSEFDITYDIGEMTGCDNILEKVFPDCGDRLVSVNDEEKAEKLRLSFGSGDLSALPECYAFESSLYDESDDFNYIEKYSGDFSCFDVDSGFAALKQKYPENNIRMPITKVNNIVFQIARLKRRHT